MRYVVQVTHSDRPTSAVAVAHAVSTRAALGQAASLLGRPVNPHERRLLARQGELDLAAGALRAQVWCDCG